MGHRCQVLCPGRESPPESETVSDLHVGLTIVSGLREALSASAWVLP